MPNSASRVNRARKCFCVAKDRSGRSQNYLLPDGSIKRLWKRSANCYSCQKKRISLRERKHPVAAPFSSRLLSGSAIDDIAHALRQCHEVSTAAAPTLSKSYARDGYLLVQDVAPNHLVAELLEAISSHPESTWEGFAPDQLRRSLDISLADSVTTVLHDHVLPLFRKLGVISHSHEVRHSRAHLNPRGAQRDAPRTLCPQPHSFAEPSNQDAATAMLGLNLGFSVWVGDPGYEVLLTVPPGGVLLIHAHTRRAVEATGLLHSVCVDFALATQAKPIPRCDGDTLFLDTENRDILADGPVYLYFAEICAGGASFSKTAKDARFRKQLGDDFFGGREVIIECITCENKPGLKPACVDHHFEVDLRHWDYLSDIPRGYLDFAWASPNCAPYSKAHTVGPRDLDGADALVLACFRFFEELQIDHWLLENSGGAALLPKRQIMERYKDLIRECCYCRYKQNWAQKQTMLCTSLSKNTLRGSSLHFKTCSRYDSCPNYRRHKRVAQGGDHKNTGARGMKTSEAQTVPRELCKDVIRMVVALLLERRHTFAKKKRGQGAELYKLEIGL